MKSRVKIEKIRIDGTEYELVMDMYALEMIEEKWGGLRPCQEELKNGKTFTTLKQVFAILANAAKEARDEEEDMTGNEIRHASVKEIAELTDLVQKMFTYSRKTETAAGQAASDEHQDFYQDEEDEKNG